VKKIAIAIIGGTVLLVGVALLVLPGPGIPLLIAGLAILATEFVWARTAVRKAKGAATKVGRKLPFGLNRFFQRRAARA
jgi:hypothetical protein